MPFYDALYDEKEIRHILTRHEQGAAHAADGYARATGRVGVCVATSGPGARIWSPASPRRAWTLFHSLPSPAGAHRALGTDAFQGPTSPALPRHHEAQLPREGRFGACPHGARGVFHRADGPPGPVVIDIPKDVLTSETDFHYPKRVALLGYKTVHAGHTSQIAMAAKEIAKAKTPIILCGGGVKLANAADELRAFVEKTHIPVTTTLMAIGTFPETHPLALGMLGMHGTAYANYAMCETDLVIALGTKFSDRITGRVAEFAANAKIIHIDIDPAEIGKTVRVDIPIVGDLKETLIELTAAVEARPATSPWLENIAYWKEHYPLASHNPDTLNPQMIMEAIYEVTNGEALIVTEVGQNQMWAAQYYTYTKPRSFITSGGLGTMGYGFPASLGVKYAFPDKDVFDIAGDGSIQMNIQELATAVYNDLDVNIVIMNNGYLGMVRQWQELFYSKRYASTPLAGNPDFVKVAEAYGAVGMRVKEIDELKPALKKALETDNTCIIDCLIPLAENVYPMVAPGACIRNMLGVKE